MKRPPSQRPVVRYSSPYHLFWLGLLLPLGGCAHSPSVNVLGAFFPDWMFCIIGAAILTACAHAVARVTGLANWLGRCWLPVIEVLLALALALGGWLLVFKN